MIYEFLYIDKPIDVSVTIISICTTIIFYGTFLLLSHLKNQQKQNTNYQSTITFTQWH
jgi:hypothetical protein|nr:MAG TPA: hypothetical protein [Caudoviricetes sp.]